MKESISTKFLCLALALSLWMLTGCSGFFDKFAKTENNTENTANTASGAQDITGLKPDELAGIQKTAVDYFERLYSAPIESYTSNSASGSIPDNINGFIAKRTQDEGDKNPEIGIHLPRYVELNGLVAVAYEPIKVTDEDNNQTPQIEVSYLGKKGDSYMLFAKVDLKARCVPSSVFNASFKQDDNTKVYERLPSAVIDDSQYESIKVQAKYDVEIVDEDREYKILCAEESSIKPGARNRLFIINNDFMVRLPYLDISKQENGKDYVNKEDGAVYDDEAAVITAFFENLKSLDSGRMDLLKNRWATGQAEFTDLIAKVGINKDKESREIMDIGSDYKLKFDIDSFPLQPNMENIKSYENFTSTPYISYSSNQKVYIVKFEASIQRINGIIDNEYNYKYDYKVTLSGSGTTLKVKEIRLNEYFSLI